MLNEISIDEFARNLLEEAKRYLEKAIEEKVSAHLHAALMLVFSSLEAHINSISEDFKDRPELCQHERGLLLEKDVRLENGAFVLKHSLKITRLEDRIKFLHLRFSGEPIDTSGPHWSRLVDALTLRNSLTHPKKSIEITENNVAQAIQAIIDIIDDLYRAIYNSPFPAANRGLGSKLSF